MNPAPESSTPVDLDFSFVYGLDEDNLNLFFNVIDLSIQEFADVIRRALLLDDKYLRSLKLTQTLEMIAFYNRLLELYTDYELYEECEEILFIIDSLENAKEQVGNMQKNP